MDNPRARIGDNSAAFGQDEPAEKLPPKALRVISLERAQQIEIAARLLKALFSVPIKHILGKRVSDERGDEGRALRRFLIMYARGLGSPVWECAMIFGLDRKQIGAEEAAFIRFTADNEEIEADVDNMVEMIDFALRVKTGRYIHGALASIAAEARVKKAMKEARRAVDALAAPLAAPPKSKPSTSEVEKLAAAGQVARRRLWLDQQIAIATAVIRAASVRGAGKDAIKDAKHAVQRLDALVAERKALGEKKAPRR